MKIINNGEMKEIIYLDKVKMEELMLRLDRAKLSIKKFDMYHDFIFDQEKVLPFTIGSYMLELTNMEEFKVLNTVKSGSLKIIKDYNITEICVFFIDEQVKEKNWLEISIEKIKKLMRRI